MTDNGTTPPRGHVKIARKAFSTDPLWLEQREFSRWEAWVDVIQIAAHTDSVYRTEDGPVDLHRGEFLASLRWLGSRWKWTVKRVRHWLQQMLSWERLRAQRGARQGIVYLIVNYDTYQSQGHSKGHGKGTAKGTPNEVSGASSSEVVELSSDTTFGRAGDVPENGKNGGAHRGIAQLDALQAIPENGAQIRAQDRSSKALTTTTKSTTLSISGDEQRVLDHYLAVHPRRRVGNSQVKIVRKALAEGYSPEELIEAIDGNAADEWCQKVKKLDLGWALHPKNIDNFRDKARASDEPMVDPVTGALTSAGMAAAGLDR